MFIFKSLYWKKDSYGSSQNTIPHKHQLPQAEGRAEGATHLLEHRRPELLCKYSSVNCQFLSEPFTKPDTTMKPRTRTLTQVNTLLTMADSFTPTVKSPENVHTQETWSINLISGKSFLGWGREEGRWLKKTHLASNSKDFCELLGMGPNSWSFQRQWSRRLAML